MSKVYTVEEGVVLRHGKPVAKIHEDTVEYLDEDAKRYRLPISRAISEYKEDGGKATSHELPRHLRPIKEVFPDAPEVWSGRGDKDPQLVKWLFDKDPEFAEKRYAGRKIPSVSGRPNNEGKTITRQCVEAQRQAAIDFRSREPADAARHGYSDPRVIREYIGAYSRLGAGLA
jgi:hypothetical protein